MIPLAFQPGYSVAFGIAFAIWVIPEWIGSFFQRSKGNATRRDRGSFLVLQAALCVGMGLGFVFAWRVPGATVTWHPHAVFGMGIGLMLAGVAFRWYAISLLGRFFTRDVAIQPGQYVIQAGPYRLIRHPSYAGSLMTCLGVGLALTNWLSVVAILALVYLGFLYRVTIEERALCETLGVQYVSYMKRTKRFIPFVL
jgi:protein-S-isoprenylcysteine O-methyltransferase Ste14